MTEILSPQSRINNGRNFFVSDIGICHLFVICNLFIAVFLMAGCVATKAPIAKDENIEEVQSAVVAVTDALQKKNVMVKYCPVCGKHYSGHLEVCPQDRTLLKEVEE